MAKKPRSPKQLANDARLAEAAKLRAKKSKAVKDLADAQLRPTPPPQEPTVEPQYPSEPAQPEKKVEVSESLLYQLMSEIETLKKNQTTPVTPEAALAATAQMQGQPLVAAPPQGNAMTPQGIAGVQVRYPVEKEYYPDPTERLYNEPRLARMALRENFIFEWDVEGVMFEKYNVTWSEPRFIVKLSRKMFDDEGNERMDVKAFVNRIYLNEDELVARVAASKFPELRELSPEDLMNEVRYLRIRDWLLALFYPPKMKVRNGASQIIIDGKPVTIEDREEFVDADRGISQANTIQRQTEVR